MASLPTGSSDPSGPTAPTGAGAAPRRLRLGVRLEPVAAADPSAARRALLERAARCESLGIDLVWIRERSGSPLALCAAVAARTVRLRIATAVVPLPLHHPLRVAEDAATVDALSDGRLELGIGLGADAERVRGFGLRAGERGDRLEEALEVLRGAWGDRPLSHAGSFHRFDGVEVHPKPARAGGPPLWLGVRGTAGAERAARLGLGALVPSLEVAEAHLAAWTRAGRDPMGARVAVELVAPDDAPAARALCGDAVRLLAAAGAVDLVVCDQRPGAASSRSDEDERRLALLVRAVAGARLPDPPRILAGPG